MPSSATIRFHFRSKSPIKNGGKERSSLFSRRYEVECDGKVRPVGWDPTNRESCERMESVLARFAQGSLTSDDVTWLAPQLRRFLSCEDILQRLAKRRERDRGVGVEFSAEGPAGGLLTNVPWEAAALSADELSQDPGALLQQLIASLPTSRIVQGHKAPIIPDSRLRALYCIANPTNGDVSTFDAASYESSMELVFRQFPVIDARPSVVQASSPAVSVALAEIADFRPHVFVFVGHGDSGDRGAKNPALCFEKWVDAREIAESLISTERTFLVVLICCDMTRDNGAQSGARILAQSGVPHIVAMQGDIGASFARMYLENFLSSLLVSYSVPLAATRGRIASAHDSSGLLQSLLPAVFQIERSRSDLFRKTVGGYRTEIQKLALRVSAPKRYFHRRMLEGRLRDALETHGLVHVTGGLGYGKTALLSQVIHGRLSKESEPPARPILYLTCDKLESRGLRKGVIDAVRLLLEKHDILLAEDILPEATGVEEFAGFLDRKKLILVLDNVSITPASNSSSGWTAFLRAAAQMKTSLVIVASSRRNPEPLGSARVISVNAFSKRETQAFVRKFLTRRPGEWEKIYANTGGVPLLLGGLRARVEKGTSLGAFPIPGVQGRLVRTVDRYARMIVRLLLPNEAQTLCNLSLLTRPTTKTFVDRFLDSTRNGRGLQSLKRVGVLRSAVIDGEVQFDIPGSVVESLTRVCAGRVRRAANLITERFEGNLPKEGKVVSRYIRSIAERIGGLALLQCVQRAYVMLGESHKAGAIPVAASAAGLASESQWNLFETVLPHMRKIRDFPSLLSAADLAQGIGKQDEAVELLDSILVAGLTPYYRAKYLKLRAALWKDTKQHEAIEEIRGLYREAIPLCRRGLSGEVIDSDASEADWKDLLCDLLQNQLNALAFLEGRTLKSLEPELEELKRLEGNSPAFAYSLCLAAECELKTKGGEIDWSTVSEKLLGARVLLRGSGDNRIISQAEHLYGDYLRRKPDPELADAARSYHRAEQAARRAGEYRRLARARRRWIDVEWRELSTLKPEDACELLEEMIPSLEAQRRDSFSMRILERVCTLRAEIGAGLPRDPTERFLRKACLAGAKPMLRARSDRDHFTRALIRYLDAMKAKGNFAGAQEFVYEFKNVLKDELGVSSAENDPWVVQASLATRVQTDKKEGKWE